VSVSRTRTQSPPLWPFALAFLALTALGLAFGEMAQAARRAVPNGCDRRAIAYVVEHRGAWPGLTRFFHGVTWLGNAGVATTFTALVAVALLFLGSRRIGRLRKREAVFWLIVLVSGRALNLVLKAWFQRERPPLDIRLVEEDTFSFPSGHSVYAAIFCTMLWLLVHRHAPASPRWPRPLAAVVCLLSAVLVGASRVWLGVHYPTDVLGGLLLGVSWVIIAYLIRFGWGHWWSTVDGEGGKSRRE
jgi:undecaprenyl-diphosphatase